MSEQPKVSIIMPVFNAEKYLAKAIDSVLEQTERNFELVIVDDGSIDSSKRIIREYAAKDSRIVASFQDNSGKPAVPRNKGIKMARGFYISFLDADDVYESHKLECQLSVFFKYPETDVIFHDVVVISSSGETIGESYLSSVGFFERATKHMRLIEDDTYELDRTFYNFMSTEITSLTTQAVMLKAETLKKLPVWFEEDFVIGEDIDLWFRLALISNIKYINKIFTSYRRHEDSITGDKVKELKGSIETHTRNLCRGMDRLSKPEKRRYNRKIAKNNFHLAYTYKRLGSYTLARGCVIASITLSPTFSAILLFLKIEVAIGLFVIRKIGA